MRIRVQQRHQERRRVEATSGDLRAVAGPANSQYPPTTGPAGPSAPTSQLRRERWPVPKTLASRPRFPSDQSGRDGLRALKRRLSDVVWRQLQADAKALMPLS
jgi:hypothetical protein